MSAMLSVIATTVCTLANLLDFRWILVGPVCFTVSHRIVTRIQFQLSQRMLQQMAFGMTEKVTDGCGSWLGVRGCLGESCGSSPVYLLTTAVVIVVQKITYSVSMHHLARHSTEDDQHSGSDHATLSTGNKRRLDEYVRKRLTIVE